MFYLINCSEFLVETQSERTLIFQFIVLDVSFNPCRKQMRVYNKVWDLMPCMFYFCVKINKTFIITKPQEYSTGIHTLPLYKFSPTIVRLRDLCIKCN